MARPPFNHNVNTMSFTQFSSYAARVAARLQQSRIHTRRAFGYEGRSGEPYTQTRNTCIVMSTVSSGWYMSYEDIPFDIDDTYNTYIAHSLFNVVFGASVGFGVGWKTFELVSRVHPLAFPVLAIAGIVYCRD